MHSLYQTIGGQSECKFLVNKTYFRICFPAKIYAALSPRLAKSHC